MATIASIINKATGGSSVALGTGGKGIGSFFKKVVSIWLTPNGFKYDSARTLDDSYVAELQATGKLVILKGIKTFSDNSEDDVNETLEDGTIQVARLGLHAFAVQFINGVYFHTALHSLNSQGEYDVALVDRENNILGTQAVDGSFKGFSVGMIQGKQLSFGTDSVGQKEGLGLQLTERSEIDKTPAYLSSESLGTFKPKTKDGVNEVLVSYNAVPANAATTIVVKAVLRQDGSAFTGLAVGDFIVKVNGTTSNPTAASEVNGVYTLTVPAKSTNEVVEVSLYDNTNNRGVIVLDGTPYKSNTESAVVV